MTAKMIELLISLVGILDTFLETIADTIINGSGVGGGTLGYLNILSTVVFICLCAAFIWNVMEAVVQRARHLGDAEHAIPWKQLKKCVQILILGGLMYGASAVFYKNPKSGAYMGVSYSNIVWGMPTSTMNAAMGTLGAVDIVENWCACLLQFDADRREKVLQAIAVQDPKAGDTYAARVAYVNDPTKAPLSLVQKVKATWSAGVTASSYGSLYFMRFLLNICLFGFAGLIVMICTFFFIFQAGRTILILAFYVKLAAILTVTFVPVAIGLLYFERMRHFGIAVLKQIVVLTVVAGILGGAVQTVFSNETIKQAIVIALKSELAPYNGKVTASDIASFETVTDMETVLTMMGANSSSMAMDAAATMSVQQTMASIVGVIKIMFLLGTMLMIIAKLFDLVTGILAGYWDPFAEGSRSAG
jgi:hypothetical protein